MIKTASVLLSCAVLAYLVYLLGSVLSFLVFEHGDFVSFFKSHYPSAYRIDEYGERYLSLQHYHVVAQYAVPFALFHVSLIFLLIWKIKSFTGWIAELTSDLVSTKNIIVSAATNLARREKLVLIICFVLLAALKVYFFFVIPFHIDETFNFVYFADQGIFHSSTFANNHPLTNIISSIWWRIGLNAELSCRLTSILSSFVVHILIYSITTYFFNFRVGIFVLMLSGVTFWGNVYAIEGVAYMLMSLWVLLALIAIFLMGDGSNRGQSLFIASSILGFYTTQLFIIPFIAFVTLWLLSKWYNNVLFRSLSAVVFSVVAVALASLLLYFPMCLWSGFEATFHADMPRHDLIQMSPILIEGFSVMTEINSKSYVVVVALVIISAFYFRRANRRIKYLIALWLSIVFSILIFTLIVGMYPPSRALVFANILFVASIGVLISDLVFRRLSGQYATLVLCLVFFIKVIGSVYILNSGWQHMPMGLQDNRSYRSVNDLSAKILRYKPRVVFSDVRDAYLNFYLTFGAIKNDLHTEFIYDPTRLMEADIIILNEQRAMGHERYEQLYEGDFGRILIRK